MHVCLVCDCAELNATSKARTKSTCFKCDLRCSGLIANTEMAADKGMVSFQAHQMSFPLHPDAGVRPWQRGWGAHVNLFLFPNTTLLFWRLTLAKRRRFFS